MRPPRSGVIALGIDRVSPGSVAHDSTTPFDVYGFGFSSDGAPKAWLAGVPVNVKATTPDGTQITCELQGGSYPAGQQTLEVDSSGQSATVLPPGVPPRSWSRGAGTIPASVRAS